MNELSASEALFGFMGWLTSRKADRVCFSATEGGKLAADLVGAFCDANGLAEPGDDFHKRFVHPS